uniref:DHHA2 domain-containing protein n=1 Tax=Prasinoderma coloniale TaxID=156133 RepID=A0A7R9XUH5_9VIRI
MPVDMPRGSADHSPGSSDDGGARERERDARHSGLTDAAPSCRQSWGDFQALLSRVAAAKDAGHSGAAHALETDTQAALKKFDKQCTALVEQLRLKVKEPSAAAFFEESYTYDRLRGACFVGHINTDLDSVAGAVGAAELFGGVACRSERELNGEVVYALEEVARLPTPPLFDETPGAGVPRTDGTRAGVCLVDHNEPKQMVASLREDPQRAKRIVGLIDHHALAEGFSSAGPLVIDVRPWGSMSSIVAHLYVRLSAKMRPEVARLLMCAILSDTLNLQSVTTTDADRFAVALLAKQGGVESPDKVARQMFRCKTRWIVSLGPYAMVRGDQKDFAVDGWKFGISVLEVTDTAPVLAIADKLLLELRILKKEKGGGDVAKQLDFAFLFVVDVVNQCSKLLVCGGREYALASTAFAGCAFQCAKEGMKAPGTTVDANQTLCDVGPLVSRKAQFVPAFSHVLAAGFKCHRTRVTDPAYAQGRAGAALDAVLAAGEAKVRMTTGGEGPSRKMSSALLALYDQSTPAAKPT